MADGVVLLVLLSPPLVHDPLVLPLRLVQLTRVSLTCQLRHLLDRQQKVGGGKAELDNYLRRRMEGVGNKIGGGYS